MFQKLSDNLSFHLLISNFSVTKQTYFVLMLIYYITNDKQRIVKMKGGIATFAYIACYSVPVRMRSILKLCGISIYSSVNIEKSHDALLSVLAPIALTINLLILFKKWRYCWNCQQFLWRFVSPFPFLNLGCPLNQSFLPDIDFLEHWNLFRWSNVAFWFADHDVEMESHFLRKYNLRDPPAPDPMARDHITCRRVNDKEGTTFNTK